MKSNITPACAVRESKNSKQAQDNQVTPKVNNTTPESAPSNVSLRCSDIVAALLFLFHEEKMTDQEILNSPWFILLMIVVFFVSFFLMRFLLEILDGS